MKSVSISNAVVILAAAILVAKSASVSRETSSFKPLPAQWVIEKGVIPAPLGLTEAGFLVIAIGTALFQAVNLRRSRVHSQQKEVVPEYL